MFIFGYMIKTIGIFTFACMYIYHHVINFFFTNKTLSHFIIYFILYNKIQIYFERINDFNHEVEPDIIYYFFLK
jgi:hypothetical protein